MSSSNNDNYKNLDLITRIGEDNVNLLKLLKDYEIEKLVMVALGNSISAGFSSTDENIPLLDRNILLDVMCEEYDLDLYKYKFARVDNNSDSRVLQWITNNKTEEDMNEMNRKDYQKMFLNGKRFINKKEIDEYYSDREESDVHIQDVLFNTEEDTANIAIYNGCTGTFINNYLNGKTIKNKQAINADLRNMESVLSMIQNYNRENNSNTQVYLCGVPRISGIKMNDKYVNRKLKFMTNRYANTNFIYNPVNSSFDRSDKKITYDKKQYLLLTHLILKNILKNYKDTSLLVSVDSALYNYNKEVEMSGYNKNTYDGVLSIISEYSFMLDTADEEAKFLEKISNYLMEKHSTDFACLDKKAIKDAPIKLLRP